jgi:hypothetical protein
MNGMPPAICMNVASQICSRLARMKIAKKCDGFRAGASTSASVVSVAGEM